MTKKKVGEKKQSKIGEVIYCEHFTLCQKLYVPF